MTKNRIKKIIISLVLLLISSAAFADTVTVIKGGSITDKTYAVTYKNMKMSKHLTAAFMNDNEYLPSHLGLYYKVNGKLYLTSMFEIEYD